MKLLATSDLHGKIDDLDFTNVDLVLFAGDIAKLNGRGPWHIYDQVKWMNKQFVNICKRWPDVQFVFVPGNHDFFPIAKECFGDRLHGKDLNVKLPENAIMLIDQKYTFKKDGKELSIYGTPWVPIISHSWAFEAESDVLKEKFSSIPSNLDILVVHSPPHINNCILVDRSTQFGMSQPFGSTELANAIFEKKPKYVFCGHIHTGDHNKIMLGESSIYNVARVDECYEAAYEPLVLEI